MESMDNFRERFEALERQTEQLKQHTQALESQTHALEAHTRTVEQRLRWWRGIACGLGLLGLVSLSLQSGTAADTPPAGMGDRMAAVEHKLSAMAFDDATNEVVISGANLRIVNGLGATDTTNGLGNLIVGYNELRSTDPNCSPTNPLGCIDTRIGSHNIVVGNENNFSSFGGLVVGEFNEIRGQFASVSGGTRNTASGNFSSVSGGGSFSSVIGNTASGEFASVSGGFQNQATGPYDSVNGGTANLASAEVIFTDSRPLGGASVCGGRGNIASGVGSTVCGGSHNTASGSNASVSGGADRTAPDTDNWAAGPLFADN